MDEAAEEKKRFRVTTLQEKLEQLSPERQRKIEERVAQLINALIASE